MKFFGGTLALLALATAVTGQLALPYFGTDDDGNLLVNSGESYKVALTHGTRTHSLHTSPSPALGGRTVHPTDCPTPTLPYAPSRDTAPFAVCVTK